jgi:hypothetical protein
MKQISKLETIFAESSLTDKLNALIIYEQTNKTILQ